MASASDRDQDHQSEKSKVFDFFSKGILFFFLRYHRKYQHSPLPQRVSHWKGWYFLEPLNR